MGILEIILTIIAWNRGWNWKALIPMLSAFGIGFIAGAINPQIGIEIIVVDVFAVIALVVMVSTRPTPTITELPNYQQTPPPPPEENV